MDDESEDNSDFKVVAASLIQKKKSRPTSVKQRYHVQERLPRHMAVSSSFRQSPSDGQKTAWRLCCTFGGPAESYKMVYNFIFYGPFLGLSSKGEHHVFCKLCRKDVTCAHSGQCDSRKHIKS